MNHVLRLPVPGNLPQKPRFFTRKYLNDMLLLDADKNIKCGNRVAANIRFGICVSINDLFSAETEIIKALKCFQRAKDNCELVKSTLPSKDILMAINKELVYIEKRTNKLNAWNKAFSNIQAEFFM